MTEYHVVWAIDLDADTAREAAEKALAIHRKPDSIATVFEVRPMSADGDTLTVDLNEPEEESTCTHCGRRIVVENGRWIDPEAELDSDDAIWRETCDQHETFIADHEPKGA